MIDVLSEIRSPRLFLHFFDIHFLEVKGAKGIAARIETECRLATRLAFLAADQIFVPISSYFESPLCRRLIDELSDSFEIGIIWLVGSGANAEDFRYSKLHQYRARSDQYRAYRISLDIGELPPFASRQRSSTKDIVSDWQRRLETGHAGEELGAGLDFSLPADFERRWESVPEQLDQLAFIVPYVLPIVLPKTKNPILRNRLHGVINEAYFSSYVEEFCAGVVDDLVYLASPHRVPSAGTNISFQRLCDECRRAGVLQEVACANARELTRLRDDPRILSAIVGSKKEPSSEIHHSRRWVAMPQNLKAFIVHGHDQALLLELKDYLQNTLKFPEPIVLFQKPSGGRTIIEKFEEYSNVDVAFVLVTPDDMGGIDDKDLKMRARQNVIFELGYFMGKFGRRSGRVLLLYKGPLEMPSDLYGIIYIDVSKGVPAAGEEIRRELEAISG